MKKIIEFLKSLFKKEQASAPATYADLKKELKAAQEAQASAPVVEEAPKPAVKKLAPKSEVATETAPKKKKRYYKPKPKA